MIVDPSFGRVTEASGLIAPRIVASLPRQLSCERVDQIEDRPSKNHNVVDIAETHADGGTDADAAEERDKIPSAYSAS